MEIKFKRISDAILNSGYSYAELSKLTGISKSSLQRYATGETKKISLDCVEAIAAATGRDARYLMGWEDEKSAPAVEDSKGKKIKEIMEIVETLDDSGLELLDSYLSVLVEAKRRGKAEG